MSTNVLQAPSPTDTLHIPSWQEHANKGDGQFIALADWERLTVKERENVTLGLEERGLTLLRHGRNELVVADSKRASEPVEIYPVVDGISFCLGCNERRIPNADSIKFVVNNASTEDEAWGMLADFLDGLRKHPMAILDCDTAEPEPLTASA